MDDPIRGALREAAESGLMPPHTTILLAVSGGADSLALLYGSRELGDELGWTLAAAHVQHGWRPREADRDLAFVRGHARRLGLAFVARRVDARRESRRLKLSPEAGARHARYRALAEMAAEVGANRIATAHQRDDVIESYVIAQERKAGAVRLAGPRPLRADGVARPLLEVTRGQILEFLAARNLSYRRDASNGDLRLARNRIRRELAAREVREGPRALEELARAAAAFRSEREWLDREFAERIRPRLRRCPSETVADATLLQACPPELQRRAVEEAALPYALPGRPPMTGREREQILRRIETGRDFRFEAGRRIRFERRGASLRVKLAAR